MGLKILPSRSTVIELRDYKAELPDGFHKLTLALLCSGRAKYVPNPLKQSIDQQIVKEFNLCESEFDVCTDSCGNMTRIIHNVTYDRFAYEEFTVLTPTHSSRPFCEAGCFSSMASQYTFEIKETYGRKFFSSTEPSGLVYIEYLSTLEDEDHFMIPDHESIKAWVYQELVKECFKYMWHNGEDVLQKFQHAEAETQVQESRARLIYQRSEVQDYFDVKKNLQKRYKAMSRWMTPSALYRPRG
jgi:hypothetical protein